MPPNHGSAAHNLARNVRQRRTRLRWSQATLADAISVSGHQIGQSRISAIETYGTGVTIELADQLAQALGCHILDLLRPPK